MSKNFKVSIRTPVEAFGSEAYINVNSAVTPSGGTQTMVLKTPLLVCKVDVE